MSFDISEKVNPIISIRKEIENDDSRMLLASETLDGNINEDSHTPSFELTSATSYTLSTIANNRIVSNQDEDEEDEYEDDFEQDISEIENN